MLSTCYVVPSSVSNQNMPTEKGSSSPLISRLSFACVFFPPCCGGLALANNQIPTQLLADPFYPIVGQSRGRKQEKQKQEILWVEIKTDGLPIATESKTDWI